MLSGIGCTQNGGSDFASSSIGKPDPNIVLAAETLGVKQLFTYDETPLSEKSVKEVKSFADRMVLGKSVKKVVFDYKALRSLIQHGGVLEVILPDLPPVRFVIEAQKVQTRLMTVSIDNVRDGGYYEFLGIGVAEDMVVGKIIVNGKEFLFDQSFDGAITYLIPTDPSRAPSHHAPGEQRPKGNEKISITPLTEPVQYLEKEGLREKAAPVNIRVGVLQTANSLAERPATSISNSILLSFKIYLNQTSALTAGAVTFELVGAAVKLDYADAGKTLKAIHQELNDPKTTPLQLASHRLQNKLDLLIVVVGSKEKRNQTSDTAIGYAYIGGDFSKSVIVLTSSGVLNDSPAHEVGHFVGADHDEANAVSPWPVHGNNYGYVLPSSSYYPPGTRRSTIMVDTNNVNCPLSDSCPVVPVWSQKNLVARSANLGTVVPIPQCFSPESIGLIPSPCPTSNFGGTSTCQVMNRCQFLLPDGNCLSTTRGAHTPERFLNDPSMQGWSCVSTGTLIPNYSVNQTWGNDKADSAAMWATSRPLQISQYRNLVEPGLVKKVTSALSPIITAMFDD